MSIWRAGTLKYFSVDVPFEPSQDLIGIHMMMILSSQPVVLDRRDVSGDDIGLAFRPGTSQGCRDLGIKIEYVAGFPFQALPDLPAANKRAADIIVKKRESLDKGTLPGICDRHPCRLDLLAPIDKCS